MSNKSIASKIQGLEQRLSAENEHRRREDPLSSNNSTTGTPVGQHRGTARRPRLMNTTARGRPEALNLPPSLPSAMSQQDSETENRLRDLRMRMRNLTINNHTYPSDIKDLEHLGELGNGTCGHVVKMLHKPSQAVIAVKQMRRSGNSEENKRILMDLDIVLRSQCPYIVRCFGCFVTEADVWICMELMASCFDKILKRLGGAVPEDILGKVTVSTVKALSYLKEEHGVIHRDVKPSNILVDSRGSIKLCDFGISGRLVDSKAKTRSAGCAAYMAPERIDPPNPQEPDYDIRADVWSLGISLVELATGIFPYRDCQNDFEVLSKVINDEPPTLPENITFSNEFRSFVQQCLTKDFSHRPKYNALLQHPFLVQSEASGVRVDEWLLRILPRSEMSPSTCTPDPIQSKPEEPFIMSPMQQNKFINNKMLFKLDSPLLNGSSKQTQRTNVTDVDNVKSSPDRGDNDDSPTPPHSEPIKLNDSKKSSQESPDQSFSESSKASCVSVEQNSSLNNSVSSRLSVEEAARTSTDKHDVAVEANASSMENLVVSSTPRHVIEDLENTRIVTSPIDKNLYKIHRNYVHTESYSNQYNPGVPIMPSNRTNYTPVTGTSPKEYYIQQRGRSLSNTMVYGNDRTPPPRYIAASPNTKSYMGSSEVRNQPFSGGGTPSLESYIHQDETPQHHIYPPCTYGSPEVNRRQYFSPSRNRPPPAHPGYDYERSRQPSTGDAHHNLVSPPNFALGGYENVQDGRLVSPPCFRNNAPTNYFTSSVYTMSRFGGVPNVEQGSIGYHHNPGGSCSQPASLEAYGDSRHPQYVVNSRPPEKNYTPGLWSPQPIARRSAREREDRWKNETQHHPQVAGNTSPIVLQRFYHQQSQRRSRRDLRDGSPSQRSASRDTSIGRSPEPPRRAHRDPSTGRTDPPLPMDQQSILERLEKERERMPAAAPAERERDLHIPERDTSSRQSSRDLERQQHQQQPDLIRPQHRYERDARYSQDCRDTDNPLRAADITLDNNQTLVNNTPKERYEFRTRNEPYNRSSRDSKKNDSVNGECRSEKDDIISERDNLTSPRERFEQKLQERRNNKETYVFPRDRERRDEPNGDVQHSKSGGKEDVGRLSPVASHKHGKTHKDKDEQGSSSGNEHHRSLLSSPPPSMMHYSSTGGPSSVGNTNNGKDGHSRVPRFGGGIPRRIADCDQDISAGAVLDKKQEYGHFVNSYRYRNSAPQPPPRRGATESWSLPASPLPARPL